MIRVGVLTSSRADFGIYLPLLKALQKEEAFHLELIVFGMHAFASFMVTRWSKLKEKDLK